MTPSPCHSCTAIILAGGSAKRMGRDKRFLAIGSEKLLERQVRFLQRYFEDVLVSANDPEALQHLGVPVIPDENPGQGPLGGLTSALATTHSEYNFVVAVDIPDIDMKLVEKMRMKLDDVSAVIPVTVDGNQEPLFAFYSKHCVPIFRSAMKEGERAIHRALEKCPVYYFPIKQALGLKNLNSPSDYEKYLKSR